MGLGCVTPVLHSDSGTYPIVSCAPGAIIPLTLTVVAAGGAEEIRTPDLRRAKAALSQLSYGPLLQPGDHLSTPERLD